MENVHLICKEVGMTPLESVNCFCKSFGKAKSKTSYAGRLDPMAEGLLIALEGEECSKQEVWQNHSKIYCWEILLGFESDSYDVLGIPNNVCSRNLEEAAKKAELLLSQLKGKRNQPYPPFSAIRVDGHPLFWWARNGRLGEIQIPSIEVEILSSEVCCTRWIKASDVLSSVLSRVSLVNGKGFRQVEVCAAWREQIAKFDEQDVKFPVLSVRTEVSSGFYVRSIANEAGKVVGCGGLAWRIFRSSVAGFDVLSSWHTKPMSKSLFLNVLRIVRQRTADSAKHK